MLHLVFFVSGFSALVFETLWFYQLGLVLGNTVWASSLTLSAFMTGLALGNALVARPGRHLDRPIRAYAFLEATIAVFGVALVWGIPALHSATVHGLASLGQDSAASDAFRVVVSFLLLVIPATSMGATLPLLGQALSRHQADFGETIGRLYGWNTVGAVAGVLTVEFVLIGALGIRASALVGGACNLAAAASALWIAGKMKKQAEARASKVETDALVVGLEKKEQPSVGSLLARAWPWMLLAFVTGAVLMALEVVWFRTLALLTPNSSAIFSVMLAVVLAGIAVGGFIGGRFTAQDEPGKRGRASEAISALLIVAAFLTLFGIMNIPDAPLANLRGIVAVCAALMFPTSVCSGIVFILIGQRLREETQGAAAAVAALTLSNTLGAAFGPLVAGFVLLPKAGIEASYLVAAGLYAAAGAFAWSRERPSDNRLVIGTSAALVVACALFPFGELMNPVYVNQAVLRDGELVAVREGLTETSVLTQTSYLGQPHHLRLVTDGFSMSGTRVDARRYMRLYVWLPVALKERIDRALLISFGVGQTATELARSRAIKRVDVVDISRDIVTLSDEIYGADHPLKKDHVEVIIEDGRHYLETTDRRYDLITSEPPPPGAAGVVSLYTREYFALLRDRLNDGGMVTYWLPLHSLYGGAGLAVTRAFCDVFDDCSLWSGCGEELMLVGTRGYSGPVEQAWVTRQWSWPELQDELEVTGFERPEQLLATFVADASQLEHWLNGVAPVTDDAPHRIIGDDDIPLERAQKTYVTWTGRGDDPAERFARSTLISRWFSKAQRAKVAQYFAAQRLINKANVFESWAKRGFPQPITLSDLDEAADLAAGGPLPALRQPLTWLLGTEQVLQNIVTNAAAAAREAEPQWRYHWALAAVIEGETDEALARLERVGDGNEHTRRAVELRLWMLRRAGREGERAALAANQESVRGDPAQQPLTPDSDALWTVAVAPR